MKCQTYTLRKRKFNSHHSTASWCIGTATVLDVYLWGCSRSKMTFSGLCHETVIFLFIFLLFFFQKYKHLQKVTKLCKKINVCYILFPHPFIFCIHFYCRKVETSAECMLWSKAAWRHFYKPIPLLFIALRRKTERWDSSTKAKQEAET